MRIVVYDDEDMEPITVLDLKGVTYRDIERVGMVWRVPVPPSLPHPMGYGVPAMPCAEVVTLHFERFIRKNRDGRHQESLIVFTKAAALAMRLKPGWLPGQRPTIDYLQSQNDFLTGMIMECLEAGR